MGFVGKAVAALRVHWISLTLVCLCALTRTRNGTTDVTLPAGRSTLHIARRGLFDALVRALATNGDT